MKKPELLMPAGSLETLKTAVNYGADAVYMGGEAFSLRARADNFGREAMEEAISFAHAKGAKVYVAVNIFARNHELKAAGDYLERLGKVKPDALIISNPGVFLLARERCPGLSIHISTQANSTNYLDFCFWRDLGASRVVCARELSLKEIAQIRKKLDEDEAAGSPHMDIEAFVHGSMCISYSGRCLMSAFMTGRSANAGACTHPCRWKYALVEEKRPGEYYPVEEDGRGTYIMNSRDLCMAGHIPELIRTGINSFKVEGRMKTELYAATCARTYRAAIDDFFEDEGKYLENIPGYMESIQKCTYRDYSTGFYFGQPSEEGQIYGNSSYIKDYLYLGTVARVTDTGYAVLTQKNKFSVGDEIEILKPGLKTVGTRVLDIRDALTGESQESCPHARQLLHVLLEDTPDACDVLGAYGSKLAKK